MVSNYFFCQPDQHHTAFYRPDYDAAAAFQVGFQDWAKAFCVDGKNENFRIRHFAYDQEGRCLVDAIFKIEEIEHTLPAFLQKIGIRISQIPKENATEHRPYWEYYDDETRRIVETWFQEDLRIGHYHFGA